MECSPQEKLLVRPMALVVEADKATADTMRRQLAEIGFDSETTATGVGGIVAARERPPAVVFVALQLKDVGGIQFVGWLRSNPTLTTVPVIALGAFGESDPGESRRRFAAMLKKPVSAAALRNALTTALPPLSC